MFLRSRWCRSYGRNKRKILFLYDAVPTLLQTSFAPILRPEEYILHLSASPLPRTRGAAGMQ